MLTLKVHLFDTNKVSLSSLLESIYLSQEDLLSLQKYKVEEVKKEKAISLIFKRKYIGEFTLNEFNKPISKKSFFNISHSHGVVAFIQDNKNIGIDIEKNRPVDDKLIDYISSKEEKEYIKNDKNFFEIWTNKESLTKCIGTGIKNNIKEIISLPLNGIKTYQEKNFFTRTILYRDFIISISRESEESFDVSILENL